MERKLEDLIDIPLLQELQEKLNRINPFPSAVIDIEGKILTAVAWQDICTKFHRKHPECEKECIKSDQFIFQHVKDASPAVTYQCPHGLIDCAIPIIIGDEHLGNFFTGQFFLEKPDPAFFRKQAKRFGFNEEAYLEAVEKVPVWSREKLDYFLEFVGSFINVISELNLRTIREIDIRKALRISEERHRTIIKTALDGFWITDREGKILEVNETYCRLSGFTEEELVGMKVTDLEDFESKEITAVHIDKIIEKGEDRFVTRHKRKNGSSFDVEVSVKYQDAGADIFVVFLRDVTEQKLQDEEREETSRLITLLNTPGDIRERISKITGSLQKWIGCEAVGIRLQEGNDFPYYETRGFLQSFVVKEKYLCAHNKTGEVIKDASGNPVLECMCGNIICSRFNPSLPFFTEHGSFWTNSTTKLLASTSEKDRQARTRNRCHGEGYESVALIPLRNGNQTFGLLQFNDKRPDRFSLMLIQKLERVADTLAIALSQHFAEETLRESERRFRQLFDASPDGIVFIDSAGIIKQANLAQSRLYGFNSPAEMLGMPAINLVAPSSREKASKIMKNRPAGEDVPPVDYELIRANTTTFYGETVATLLRDDKGAVTGYICVTRDITDRRQAALDLIKAKEKAEESDRLKTAFIQNMSHEIRTPMNAIMGFSDLLAGSFDNRVKLEKFSRIINQRSADLLDIINDILDVAKIESGQLPVNIEKCNINQLFSELNSFFNELQKRIGKEHLNMSLHILCDQPVIEIDTDPVKLRQVFINLISNALKFTENGWVEGGCKTDVNGQLVFYVADSGIGIPPDKKDVIFDRFSQLKQQKNNTIGGTGLGLSIVRGLVKLLGGDIWLESEVDKGTTFYFTVSGQPEMIREEMPPNVSENTVPYNIKNKRVLIVEDDLYNAEYLKEVLSDLNIQIIYTRFGKEAIRMAEVNKPDVILMDIHLPDINGFEATKVIKQKNPGLIVIAQTAFATLDDRQKAKIAGCSDYISKPLKRETILNMIGRFC